MGKIFKFGCLGIIALFVIGIIAMVAGGGDSTEKTSTDTTAVSKEGVSSDVKIAVGPMETVDSVGNEYTKEQAQGVFKILEVTLTNNQKDAITVDANSFKLVDNKGREFTYSTQGQTSFDLANGGKTDFFLKQLNPGLTQTGKIVFDIPKDAEGIFLKASGGMTGKEIKLKVE
ncbi:MULTISPECIES: DUF4352 domain-containing protein [Bacillus]|uniref:DUF4352 domain-containing protein n=1 Tax=Bacillus TaxID=1386 RepID=UPI00077A6817|nr:DUF4352 domain-containing protein [Bacillus thuringiensis]KXY54723.1 glycerophosphoryl diester phosphodiesterase [Bacillus cereus]PEC13163.1 DUF4352 domain-containing protein [Bacillus thuringiensis]PEV16454.1 DUF4352 domain-containing protein [Bacillus thuringiensis]PGV67417.1 DUF4352 domain-containing protein [Bacillus thuringiensis]